MIRNSSSIFKLLLSIVLFVLSLIIIQSCSDNTPTGVDEPIENGGENPEDGLEIYKPDEFTGMDFDDNSSTWSFDRSRESEHFIVFWGKGYDDEDPGSQNVDATYRVDIDDLLEKSELFYDQNINDLKFAEIGLGNSNLDQYKMMIFLHHQEDWLATGAGYDDVIGALWISPGTAQPVGPVIAHEIGHSFQYQVFSDLGNGSGFRYGFGGNGGNAFWEQTANWQAMYAYPDKTFRSSDFGVYVDNYHKHIHHEDYRYASYFIHYYWTDKHGLDFIGRLWREAREPEDPMEAYMRLTGIETEELNDEIYDAAARFVTWDLDELRNLGRDHIGDHQYQFNTLDDGSHMVAYESAPQTTGYNVIPLQLPETDETVSVEFTGMENADGFNTVDETIAGWRYGFVALLQNGERVYGDMNRESEHNVSFEVPADAEQLWFVVTGAPTEYSPHAWDDDNSNDQQWPYKVKFSNTNISGVINLPDDGTPENATLTYDVTFPASETEYNGAIIEADISAVANSFLMQPNEISSAIGEEIHFYALENDGDLNPETTANGYGHWFDAQGNVTEWGDAAVVYSEFNENNFSFSIGQFPGRSSPGESYTIKQALIYEYEQGKSVGITFEFEILIY